MSPDSLSVSQQQAMLDWLHWGGQLVLIGGAGPSFSIFRDSFLDPYLPADPTGESQLLGEDDLKPLSEAYPPPCSLRCRRDARRDAAAVDRPPEPFTPSGPAVPRPRADPAAANRPVFVAGLRPRPGAATIPLGEGSPAPAGRRGAGGPRADHDADDQPDRPLRWPSWPGLDTLIRRVVLRRPEEEHAGAAVGSDAAPFSRRAGQPWRGPT